MSTQKKMQEPRSSSHTPSSVVAGPPVCIRHETSGTYLSPVEARDDLKQREWQIFERKVSSVGLGESQMTKQATMLRNKKRPNSTLRLPGQQRSGFYSGPKGRSRAASGMSDGMRLSLSGTSPISIVSDAPSHVESWRNVVLRNSMQGGAGGDFDKQRNGVNRGTSNSVDSFATDAPRDLRRDTRFPRVEHDSSLGGTQTRTTSAPGGLEIAKTIGLVSDLEDSKVWEVNICR